MAKGGDPSPVQPLYVGGNAYCGVPVAEQERDVVHIDAPLTIAVEESDDGPVVSVEVPAALASERVPIVGTADLGTPRIVEALYENPNGTPILFDTDIAGEADRPFWAQAAKASREYLVTACHPQTGMNPEYSNYDGTPHVDERDHWHFYSDAYRTAGNIGLDCLWNGVVPDLCDANARLQRFFLEHDRTCVYAIDGTPVDETVLHPVGFIAATAEGSLAAMHSQEPDALDNAIRWVRLLWDTPIRTGTRRYYDNFLYAFAFLALAGEYRVW